MLGNCSVGKTLLQMICAAMNKLKDRNRLHLTIANNVSKYDSLMLSHSKACTTTAACVA